MEPVRLSIGVLMLAACGSSSAPAADARPDNACGPGPYVHAHAGVASFSTHLPVAGATATLDACPEHPFVADELGYFDLQMTQGLPFDPRIEAAGFVTMRSGESTITADLDLGYAPLFPTDLMSLFPDDTASSPALVVITALPAGTQTNPNDPCTDRSGVTFSVVGHPEATLTYYGGSGSAPVLDPSLTATTTVGAVEIGGLAQTDAATIEIAAAKTGCTISCVSYPHTGHYKLENGVLSLAGAFMPPVPPP
ncbi:MAG TPA: hypothetical protein VL463_12320 [Kofleriaceae bacterium]|nr:hypothetical protein [Kofleriaceae bacterium]